MCVKFWVKILAKEDNRNNSVGGTKKGRARASRARPFAVAVKADVSVVLFDLSLIHI